MTRPRLLYVPILAGFEAQQFAELVDWGDVATFDAPGAGARRDQQPRGLAGVVEAALERLDELGWDSCCVVCDSHAQAAAIDFALRHRERVDALVVGHAAADYRLGGERPAMTPAIHAAAAKLLETDYRTFARAITQLTQGLVGDEYVERWIEDVPQPVAQDLLGELSDTQPELVSRLAGSGLPTLLGQHRGCVMWTPEAFEEAVRVMPDAHALVCDGIPTQDREFLAAAREIALGDAVDG